MSFLYNADAERGVIFREIFTTALPDIPFAMSAAEANSADVRYLFT